MLRLCCALPLFNKRQLFLNEVPHKPTNPPCTAATTEDKNPMAPSWRNHILQRREARSLILPLICAFCFVSAHSVLLLRDFDEGANTVTVPGTHRAWSERNSLCAGWPIFPEWRCGIRLPIGRSAWSEVRGLGFMRAAVVSRLEQSCRSVLV